MSPTLNDYVCVFSLIGTLGGLFEQILKGEDTVRERAIKFLSTKLKNLSSELITKDVEEFLVEKSKEVSPSNMLACR